MASPYCVFSDDKQEFIYVENFLSFCAYLNDFPQCVLSDDLQEDYFEHNCYHTSHVTFKCFPQYVFSGVLQDHNFKQNLYHTVNT